MWPTAETCDATLLSSPSRLWLTWCLETEAIFIFSNSKFLWGNLCNICQHWFKSECFAWDSWSFHKRSITIITNTNHKKVSLLWKKMKPVKSHGSKLSYMLVAESMPFFYIHDTDLKSFRSDCTETRSHLKKKECNLKVRENEACVTACQIWTLNSKLAGYWNNSCTSTVKVNSCLLLPGRRYMINPLLYLSGCISD